ncbi:MAG: hypothetical protein PVG30_07380 [Gammaproteobacteria bacterium]
MLVKIRLKTIKNLEKFLFDQKLLEIKKDCEKLLERKQDHSANEKLIKLKIKCRTFLRKVNLTDYEDIKSDIKEIMQNINEDMLPLLKSELNKINKKYDLVMKYYNISNNDMDSFVVLPYGFLQKNIEENPKQLVKEQVLKNAPLVRKKYKKFLKKIKGAGFRVLEMECNSKIANLNKIIKNCDDNKKICNIL